MTTRHVSLRIDEALDLAAREELVMDLLSVLGIERAVFRPEDPHALDVDYDSARFSELTLVDFLRLHGATAHPSAQLAASRKEHLDERLDEALDETFPASDPVAVHRPGE